MAKSTTPSTTQTTTTEEPKKFRVRVVISSLGNESRKIELGECSQEQIQEVIRTVNSAFDIIRKSQSLMLTGSDGVVVYANLDNVAFVEVHVA